MSVLNVIHMKMHLPCTFIFMRIKLIIIRTLEDSC